MGEVSDGRRGAADSPVRHPAGWGIHSLSARLLSTYHAPGTVLWRQWRQIRPGSDLVGEADTHYQARN